MNAPVLSHDDIIARLEEAGAAMLALPHRGHGLATRSFWPEIVRDFWEAYGGDPGDPQPLARYARARRAENAIRVENAALPFFRAS